MCGKLQRLRCTAAGELALERNPEIAGNRALHIVLPVATRTIAQLQLVIHNGTRQRCIQAGQYAAILRCQHHLHRPEVEQQRIWPHVIGAHRLAVKSGRVKR